MANDIQFGAALHAARTAAGMTADELTEKVGMKYSACVRYWQRGERLRRPRINGQLVDIKSLLADVFPELRALLPSAKKRKSPGSGGKTVKAKKVEKIAAELQAPAEAAPKERLVSISYARTLVALSRDNTKRTTFTGFLRAAKSSGTDIDGLLNDIESM